MKFAFKNITAYKYLIYSRKHFFENKLTLDNNFRNNIFSYNNQK